MCCRSHRCCSRRAPWKVAPNQPRLHTTPDRRGSAFRQPVGGLSLPVRKAPSAVRCARYESAFRKCVEAVKRPSSRNPPMNVDDSLVLGPKLYLGTRLSPKLCCETRAAVVTHDGHSRGSSTSRTDAFPSATWERGAREEAGGFGKRPSLTSRQRNLVRPRAGGQHRTNSQPRGTRRTSNPPPVAAATSAVASVQPHGKLSGRAA